MKLFKHIAQEQRLYAKGILDGVGVGKRLLHTIIGFIGIFYREIMRDKIFIRASAIAYTSMLSLIPLLVVGGSLLMVFNQSLKMEELIELLQEHVIPVAGDQITEFLTESLQRTLALGTGPVGAVALLVTSVMLFIQIEDVINDIWQVGKARAYFIRVLLFYAIVTLGPVLLSISIYQATQVLNAYNEYRFLRSLSSFGSSVLTYFLVFKLFPNTKVRLASAFWPALSMAIFLEILKYGFSFYISMAFSRSYGILYGALGLVPVFLVWTYLLWILTLLGVQASFCVQNFNVLLRRSSIRSDDTADDWYFLDPYAPLEVLGSLVRNFANGRLPLDLDEISLECLYPNQALEAILAKFTLMGLAKDVETEDGKKYLLTRPLENIDLKHVMAAFDESDTRTFDYPNMKALFDRMLTEQNLILEGLTGNDLREDTELNEAEAG